MAHPGQGLNLGTSGLRLGETLGQASGFQLGGGNQTATTAVGTVGGLQLGQELGANGLKLGQGGGGGLQLGQGGGGGRLQLGQGGGGLQSQQGGGGRRLQFGQGLQLGQGGGGGGLQLQQGGGGRGLQLGQAGGGLQLGQGGGGRGLQLGQGGGGGGLQLGQAGGGGLQQFGQTQTSASGAGLIPGGGMSSSVLQLGQLSSSNFQTSGTKPVLQSQARSGMGGGAGGLQLGRGGLRVGQSGFQGLAGLQLGKTTGITRTPTQRTLLTSASTTTAMQPGGTLGGIKPPTTTTGGGGLSLGQSGLAGLQTGQPGLGATSTTGSSTLQQLALQKPGSLGTPSLGAGIKCPLTQTNAGGLKLTLFVPRLTGLTGGLTGQTSTQLPEKEYDFVEELSQDYLCPVTLELLRDPQQTTCCGHHLSLEAATRLQQGGKPCPMCNEPNLATIPDKFYKRKVNELKVRCPNKGNECEWVGDLGSMDQHVNSCPKRPWQCDFCGLKGTYEVVTNDHLLVCVKYPEPCPNQCEIASVPRCDLEKHLTECPLQLVECEFSQAGCHERIPRQDLSCHMEEGAQRHLLSISLFNLNLTRELHKKMAEKDQQIATLQEQNRELQQQGRKAAENLKQQMAMLEQQVARLQDQQEKKSENQLKKTTILLEELDKKVVASGQKVAALQTKVEQQAKQMNEQLEQHRKEVQEGVLNQVPQLEQQAVQLHDKTYQALSKFKEEVSTHLGATLPLFHHELIIVYDKKGNNYCSEPFYCQGYKFKLNIDLLSNGSTNAYLYPLTGNNDDHLCWPIECKGQLLLLNQLGDHNHRTVNFEIVVNKSGRNCHHRIVDPFTKAGELDLNAERHTQYLKDDSLHFRWFLTVVPK